MENNKNKKSVKFQEDMLNFYDFIQVFVFTTNHHLKKHLVLIVPNNKEQSAIKEHAKKKTCIVTIKNLDAHCQNNSRITNRHFQ